MQNNSLKLEIVTLFKLLLPICLGQLAGLSMTFVDTIMSGRAGAVHMASVAIAGSVWVPITVFGQGLMMTVTPFVAQSNAKKTEESLSETKHYFRQGVWLMLGISTLILCVVLLLSSLIKSFGFDPQLAELASDYLLVMSIGVFPLFFYAVQRYYLEGLGLTRPTMFVGFLSFAVNIPLNYIFIFGKLGMPALGAVGCAVASMVVCFVMAIGMNFFVRRAVPNAFTFEKPNFTTIKQILFISFPSAVATLMEMSLFSMVAIFIAPLGTEIVAGHQVALNATSMLFMIPFSLCVAASIRSGNAYGLKDIEQSKTVRKATYTLAIAVGVMNACIFFFGRGIIANIYSNEPQVIELAMSFMLFAGVYQIVDSLQVSSIGILRGYNDTKAIFFMSFFAYWCIAFPFGYILSFHGLFGIEPLGAYGFWIGMVVGLTIGCALFTYRVLYLEKLPPAQLYKKLLKA